jgi:hypothetical protein
MKGLEVLKFLKRKVLTDGKSWKKSRKERSGLKSQKRRVFLGLLFLKMKGCTLCTVSSFKTFERKSFPRFKHRVLTPPPLPLHVATAGKNHLNEEITPLLIPNRIGVRYCQTISNLSCADVNSPYKQKC